MDNYKVKGKTEKLAKNRAVESRSQNMDNIQAIGIYDDFAANEDADFGSGDSEENVDGTEPDRKKNRKSPEARKPQLKEMASGSKDTAKGVNFIGGGFADDNMLGDQTQSIDELEEYMKGNMLPSDDNNQKNPMEDDDEPVKPAANKKKSSQAPDSTQVHKRGAKAANQSGEKQNVRSS